MANQILQEISKLTINITKFQEAPISWHESYLTVLSEKGIHIYELSHNLRCLDKKIDFIQSFISHPKSSPASCLFTDRVLNKQLKNIHATEMIVDHAFWPHNSQLLQEMSTIIDFKWSPTGTIRNGNSAIAVLTNVGVVEIYIQHLFKWVCAVEISELLSKETKLNLAIPNNMETLKEAVYTLASSAICWSPTMNIDGSCYFFTAQKNGDIILWLIQHTEIEVTAKILTFIQSGTSEILSMDWIPIDIENFLLICSNVHGQIIGYCCQYQNNIVQFLPPQMLWPHKDRMISKCCQYLIINDKIVLTFNKHRHLLVLIINKHCKLLAENMNNINDYRITCLNKSSDIIYVTTVNCMIYKLNLGILDNELDMTLDLVEFQALNSTHELYHIDYSHSDTLCTISAIDRKVHCKKDPLQIELIIMSTKDKFDSLVDMLLLNPRKYLTHYWDVIEVLRYVTMKTKQLPQVDFNKQYEMACSDVYMLKVYLIFCTLSDNLKNMCKLTPEFHLPEESINTIKEEILVAHADNLIQQYYRKHQNNIVLGNSEIEYFIGARKFLEYFFEKYKKNLYDVIHPSMLDIVESNRKYICQCCEEEVTGFTCKNEHLNMFCALTFTPINSVDYLICKWCNLTARKELYPENPMCLFCDVHLTFVSD